MPALTGQGKLPIVMLSKQLSSLMDVENYTDEFSLADTLTSFKYSAGIPGAASNSFTADVSIINPSEHFEKTVLPYFRTLFAKNAENSNLQAGADDDPHALQFYLRWGYGSAEQGMSKIIHGFLTSIRYSVTADGERVIYLSFLDQLSFSTTKYPEFSRESNMEFIWEYPDIFMPDGSFTFPSVVVENLLSQMLASIPNSKGHLVLGDAGLLIDNVWLQLTDQLATGFGTKSIDSGVKDDYPIPLPQDLIRAALKAGIRNMGGDCQFITPNDNLKINAPGSYYAAQRIAYDMIMRSLGINSKGGEIGETRSNAASDPEPLFEGTPTLETDKPLPELNNYKLDGNYSVYKVGSDGYPADTGKNLQQWLGLYSDGDTEAIDNVFDGSYITPRYPASGATSPKYADHWGFPTSMPFRPGGNGYNGPDITADPVCWAGKVMTLTAVPQGMFPLTRGAVYPSPGYYVALGPLNYDTLPPSLDHIAGAGAAVNKYAAKYINESNAASDSAATHAATEPAVASPTLDEPPTKFRASIVKGEYSTFMEVLGGLLGNINRLVLPMVPEENDLLALIPYFKSNLTTPNSAGIDLWGNLRVAVGLAKSQFEDVNTLVLVASKNLHNQSLTNDAGDSPSDISILSQIQSFPSISTSLPAGPTKNVENGSITSLLLFRVGYDNSIVTDLTFDTDIFAPIVSNAAAQGYIQKLDKVWGKGVLQGVSTNKVVSTMYYVLKKSVDAAQTEESKRRSGGHMNFDKTQKYEGVTDTQLEDIVDAGVKSMEALENAAKNPLELDMTDFLAEMNKFYMKYQRVNQEGLLSTADDTSERLDALFNLINSSTFKNMFLSTNGNESSYVINGKNIEVKSTPKWKLELSMMSQVDDSISLSQFLRNKGMWDRGFAQIPFTVTVTTLGIPELSSFVEDDAFRKVNLDVSNPRLTEGPKHWTSGVYQILGYTHNISSDSVYTTTFNLLRQPFVEFN